MEAVRLRKISQNYEAIETASFAIEAIRGSIDEILGSHNNDLGNVNSVRYWNKLLEILSGFVGQLEEKVDFFTNIIPPDKSAKDAISAMDACLRFPQAIKSLNSFEPGINLLGKHFRGLETDIKRVNETYEWGRTICSSGLEASIVSSIFMKGTNVWDRLIKTTELILIKWEEV